MKHESSKHFYEDEMYSVITVVACTFVWNGFQSS